MATSIGAQGQLGLGLETTYGTPVTPTRFYPFTSEGLDRGQAFDVTKAMRSDAPRLRTATMQQLGKRDARGPITVEVNNKGFGYLLKAALGAVTSTQPSAGPDPTVWDHTFIPAAALTPQMHSIEVAWNDLAVSPFGKTLSSAMVDKMSIGIKTDELATATFDWIGRDLAVATSKTAPSYPAGLTPFSWANASLTLGGAAADAVDCQIDVNNNLDADRYYLGGGGMRKQPLAPTADVTATLTADFIDWTAYNRAISNTFASLVITMPGAIISTTLTYRLMITMNVQTQGDTPKLTGPGRIQQPLKLVAYDDGSGPGSAITIAYRTTDTTP